MALALKEGRAVRGTETIAERPDGKRVWFMPYPTPLRDAEGRVVGGINMLLDITERKQGERAAALLSSIVDSSEDAIVSKDLNGIITSWNKSAERLFGYSAEEAIGQSITMLIPANRRGEEAEILDRLRRGERVDHFDTIRIRKDRSPVPISLTISPIRDSVGRIIGASKIARDITSRKEMEAALKEADRRKDEFLATLAHELRNPLAPIRNAVQILMAKGPPDPELQWARGVIDRQVQQMARLLDDLLDVSRISRNTTGAPQGAGRPGRGGGGRPGDQPPAHRGRRPRTHRHSAARADPPGRRPGAAGPGVRQPAQQRRQVHRGGRSHLARPPSGRGAT